MPRLILTRLARRMAGAFLTLLAWSLLAPGSARAGCLHDRPSASHFEHLVMAGAMPEADDAEMARSSPGPMPTCDGPMCSRGPAAPQSPSWTVPTGNDSWACLVETLAPDLAPHSPLPTDAVPALPEHRAPSIFHPPRVSSL